MFRNLITLFLWAVSFSSLAQNVDLLLLNKKFPEALVLIGKSLEVQKDAELNMMQAYALRQ